MSADDETIDTSALIDADWREGVLVSCNRRDLILYALGIGCTELRFIHEDADGFAPFPTYPVVLGFKGDAVDVVTFPSPAMMAAQPMVALPGIRTVLDAERYIEMVRPLPEEGGSFSIRSKVVSVQKKGKGAVVHIESELRGEGDELFYRLHAGAFAVGARGFTSSGTPPAMLAQDVPELPKRPPDAVSEQTVGVQQAQLYRLSGDYNPLHVDPDAAAMAGFEQPILHGLCTLGFAVRMVLGRFAAGDEAAAFRAVRCRFVGPVMPGETLVTKMWLDGAKVYFRTEVKERAKVAIANAFVELRAPPESAVPPPSKL